MTTNASLNGIVLNYQSNFYTVKVEKTEYRCFLKGILKKEGTSVFVGDMVTIDNHDDVNLSARIIKVLPRTSLLTRPKIANIDKAIIVASIKNPSLDFQQLDRYLTQIQLANIQPVICISKIDLNNEPSELEKIEAVYASLHIPVYFTSIQNPEEIHNLFNDIKGYKVVLAGLSGVGKSSLLNAFNPDLKLSTGKVSIKLQHGQHTTRYVSLIDLGMNTLVADTPGFSYLKFDETMPRDIEKVFAEFEPFSKECHYDNCLHLDESGCAIEANIEKISPSRMESYRIFQEEARMGEEIMLAKSQKHEYGYKTLAKGKNEDLQILKLSEKQRTVSRRKQKQHIGNDWHFEDATLE